MINGEIILSLNRNLLVSGKNPGLESLVTDLIECVNCQNILRLRCETKGYQKRI